MSDTWEERRDRLEALLALAFSCEIINVHGTNFYADIRAALERIEHQTRAAMLREIDCANLEAERNDLRQRVELYAEQERAIRSEFGWERDGKPLIECLRQRVEELERELAEQHKMTGAWCVQAEAAEAKLAKAHEELTQDLSVTIDNWQRCATRAEAAEASAAHLFDQFADEQKERIAAENKLADEKESRGWLEAQLRASDAKLAKVVEAGGHLRGFAAGTDLGKAYIASWDAAVKGGE